MVKIVASRAPATSTRRLGPAGARVQLLLSPPDCPAHSADVIPAACVEADRISDVATYWALGIGALAAIILFFLLRKAVMRLSPAGEHLRDV